MGQPVIEAYDARWAVLAAAEGKAVLQALGGRLVAIEHVGSTAVSGLAAKPIIDLMAGVRRLADADQCIETLRGLGYVYVPEAETVMPDNRYFEKWVAGTELFHLHVTEYLGQRWRDRLLFRDYLRRHPEAAARYERLKRQLAAQFTSGGPYSLAKNEFIQAVLASAGAADAAVGHGAAEG